jgi:hypothetical protein
MENGQNVFFDFIIERTQDDKKEVMAEFLKEAFKPPEGGGFDPDAMQKNNEVIMTMLKPEAVPEVRRRLNPFDDSEPLDEALVNKNWLEQPNKFKWRDTSLEVSPEDMRAAFACSKDADKMSCECWNTHCPFYGDCRKCIVFHLCLKQFPTCQRTTLGDLEEHYILFSRDGDK